MNDTSPARKGPDDDEIQQAVPRDSGGRQIRVGLFVLLGIASFIAVLFLLTDPATLRGRYMLVTRMSDVGGVRKGDPIQMRGVNIGRVHGFHMTGDGEVDMTMEIEGEWSVPEGSLATLTGIGLFGGRTVDVIPGEGDAFYEPWDTIPGQGSESDVFGKAENVTERAETVLTRVADVLDEPTVDALRGSARELEALLGELNTLTRAQQGEIAELTRTLNRAAEGLEEAAGAAPDARSAVARADSTMATLNRTSVSLEEAAASLTRILGRMEAGEGTLGKLSRDDSLYTNLNETVTSIRLLVDDLRENPGRYINLSIF